MKPTIITGLPAGVKEAGQRVDFKPSKFDLAITTKGYRMWWSRASVCPCRHTEDTDQPDPNCTLCKGDGRFHFLPEVGLETNATDIYGNPIEINETGDALLISVLATGATKDPQIFERFGDWVFGMFRVTVQPENRIGYGDRLIAADSTMVWSQTVLADGSATITLRRGRSEYGLRFRAIAVTLLRSLTTVYRVDQDYRLTPDGEIQWLITPPVLDTRLSVHYQFAPTFEVLDHVHAFRDTLVAQKTLSESKAAQYRRLPIQAMAKLDFLLKDAPT